jgi:hypothetical protein
MKRIKILAVVLLFAAEVLIFSGFSFGQIRWVSDEELIGKAADVAADLKIGNVVYQSGDDLLHKNPTCCQVYRFSHDWNHLLWRLIGWYVVVAEVHFRTNESTEYPFYNLEVAFSASGKRLDNRGIEVDR